MTDQEIVAEFENFLSWGVPPNRRLPDGNWTREPKPVPPAWFAYAWGLTQHCPPNGTL